MRNSIECFELTREFKTRGFDAAFNMTQEHPGAYFQTLWYTLTGRRSTKLYKKAVDSVDLKVRKGEVLCLLGPNGSGKTTLIRLLAGLMRPTSGTARIMGYDICEELDQAIANINVVPGLLTGGIWANAKLTARQNLEYYADLFGLPRERVGEALHFAGLEERAHDRLVSFSSGMVARMILAIGVLRDAPVFLMDEPTVGIDPAGAKEIRTYIKEHLNRKLGVTILYATHNMADAEYLSDRVALMDNGRIVTVDTPASLVSSLGRAESIEVETTTEDPHRLLDLVNQLDGVEDSLARPGKGVQGKVRMRITTRDSHKLLPEMVDTIVKKANSRIDFLRITKPSLEDVFLSLTGTGLAAEG